jgi:hypothetical protein
MYTQDMALTATQLRKNLFQILDGVSKGKPAELEYKGSKISITQVPKRSRLDNLIERDLGFDEIPTGTGWSKEFQAEWEDEWKDFIPAKKKIKR